MVSSLPTLTNFLFLISILCKNTSYHFPFNTTTRLNVPLPSTYQITNKHWRRKISGKLRTKEPNCEACVDMRELVNKVSSYDDWWEVPTFPVIISILGAFKLVTAAPQGWLLCLFVPTKAFPELLGKYQNVPEITKKILTEKKKIHSIFSVS